MGFIQFITQDWKANKGNSKGRIFLVLFRIANFLAKRKFLFYPGLPYLLFYRLFVEWGCGIEIPWGLQVGKNLRLFHGQALVINRNVVMGENCTIRQCTTIGNKQLADGTPSASPKIGNNVDIGSNVCIIGDIVIGDNVVAGSGSVIVKSVEANCVVAGNPAQVKKRLGEDGTLTGGQKE